MVDGLAHCRIRPLSYVNLIDRSNLPVSGAGWGHDDSNATATDDHKGHDEHEGGIWCDKTDLKDEIRRFVNVHHHLRALRVLRGDRLRRNLGSTWQTTGFGSARRPLLVPAQ